jgi:hypothetical protein
MNDRASPCEPWAEAISLLAAGCLATGEERDVRLHLTTCPACRARFEQLGSVCEGLRCARPVHPPVAAGVVSRVMAGVAERATRGRGAAWSRSATQRQLLAAGAALAASLLLTVAWRSFFAAGPQGPAVVRHGSPAVAPAPEADPGAGMVATSLATSGPPTWLALQRAFARSDEEFDTLLAQNGDAIACAACDARSLFQESLP